VAQVARAANVSEVTVFNYFPTKEDLFYGGMQFFEEKLLDAVRERTPGTSVLEAFRRPVMDGMPRLASDEAAEVIVAAANLISASPALEAHEREIVARYTRRLADLLAAEAGAEPGDVEAIGVASALMGVQRAVVGYVRISVLAGRRGPKLADDATSQAVRGFGRLENGLVDYGNKPSR
jgi:AcrR family transcriptional regulator